MISKDRLESLLVELDFVTHSAISTVDDIGKAYDSSNIDHKEIIRLMAIPTLYAAWEKVFTEGIALCLRFHYELSRPAGEYSSGIRAVWLRESQFFSSYIDSVKNLASDQMVNAIKDESKKVFRKRPKSVQSVTQNVIQKLDHWNKERLNSKESFSELVFTFSNVDKSVLMLNAEIVGLSETNSFQKIDLSKLSPLVGIRNSIGHGELDPPGERQFKEYHEYTHSLIESFSRSVEDFLSKSYSRVKEPAFTVYDRRKHLKDRLRKIN